MHKRTLTRTHYNVLSFVFNLAVVSVFFLLGTIWGWRLDFYWGTLSQQDKAIVIIPEKILTISMLDTSNNKVPLKMFPTMNVFETELMYIYTTHTMACLF